MLKVGLTNTISLHQNVLEGIGLLIKQGKNHVSWNENPPETAAQVVAEAKGKSDDSDSDKIGSPPRITKTASVANSSEYEEMKKKLERLKEEERRVDSYLGYLKEQAAVFNGRRPPSREHMASLPPGVKNPSDQMYVRFQDITAMPDYGSETVIGIRAPTGTSLEVPDPDQGMKVGQRRYEMYLNSKGANGPGGQKDGEGSGDPINVYLVQPRAEQENRGGIPGRGGFVHDASSPPSHRGHAPGEHSKPPSNVPSDPNRHYGPRHGEPPYRYGPPPQKRDWAYGPGHRPPYPMHERGHRKGPPTGPSPGGPPYGVAYSDPSWGPPVYQGYPQPPPGYYPPPNRQPPPGSQLSPDAMKGENENEEQDKSVADRTFHPPHHEGDPEESNDATGPSPFRPRQHVFQHEVGRTASAGGDPSREPPVSFRPPSPGREQTLLNMPLQSPNEPFGFGTPPGSHSRTDLRSGDVQFPIPSFPRESRDYNDRWRPPLSTSSGSGQTEDPAPRSRVPPRPRH